MKSVGKYVRECCGRRLPAKYQFCPICGTEAKRPVTAETSAILIEIDKRARACEGNAQKMLGMLAELDAGTLGTKEYPLPDGQSRAGIERSMASYHKSALWYRSVERLISDLAGKVPGNQVG